MTAGSKEALEAFVDALLDDDAEQLYDRAPCGYLSTTPDGTIIKTNSTFLALTGFDRSELLGRRTFSELLTPGGRIYHETHYAPLLRMQGTAREIALDIVRRDGSRLPVLVNSVLEHDESGAAKVIRTAVFDATERREYERELLRAKGRAEESEARARALAQTLQQTLIPPTPPQIPGLAVAAAYRPAGDGSEVGGDFYDVFALHPGEWTVVIGDVRGKGVEAAVVTALARYTLRAAAVGRDDAAGVLQVLNDVLLHQQSDRFCTVACLRLIKKDAAWTARVSCGGHPLPLVRRAAGSIETAGAAGTLLGVVAEPELTDQVVTLHPGDMLLLYTDGITEARTNGDLYGEERLVRRFRGGGSTAESVVATVLDDVLTYQDGQARDDIALVAIAVPSD